MQKIKIELTEELKNDVLKGIVKASKLVSFLKNWMDKKGMIYNENAQSLECLGFKWAFMDFNFIYLHVDHSND